MYHARYLSPILPSSDVPATRDFLTDVLRFGVLRDSAEYCVLKKDECTLHVQADRETGAVEKEVACYLQVDDLDAVWKLLEPHSADLTIKGPFERSYGMNEIHIYVPHTPVLMFIGEPVGA